MAAMFTLKCDKLTDAVFVGFRGKEQISRPYEYEIFFTVPSGTSVRAAVGERATIRGQRAIGVDPVVIHGVLANIRLLHQSGERALYGGLLVPRLWLLRHFWRSYVFTGKTLEQFVTDTLKDGGLTSADFRFAIDADAHAEEEFVTQYRESHLDFLHRWLEREGVYYFFEHDPDAESEVMVLVEDKSAHVPFPGTGRVPYIPVAAGEATGVEAFSHIESHVSWLPRSVTIADYDYANPAVSLKSDSNVTSKGVGAIREYGYRAFVEGDLKRLAAVKAQAIGCRETTLTAVGNVIGPRAGYRMAIDHQPEDLEEEWLAVEVELSGVVAGWTEEVGRLTGLTKKQTIETKVFAVPSSVQYRAPQTTPWPRIYGLENGVVSGEADSPYAQIDDDGRYLVRFEFDTSDLPDAKVSTRVRMLQPHGGTTEGMHFPLRKGTEVMIAFLGGDPDRPFIAGVVPNARKPSVVGARNNTQNIIRTGANNQIVMEDEEGKEFIFMHTPNQSTGIYMGAPAGQHSSVYTGERQQAALFTAPGSVDPSGAGLSYDGGELSLYPHTTGNGGSFIGGDSWQEVGGAENIFVKGAVAHGYKVTYDLKVGGATTENYYATRETTTHGLRTDTHKAGFTHTVETAGMTQTITDHLEQTIHGPWTNVTDGKFDGKFSNASVKVMADGGKLSMHADTAIYLDAPDIYLTAKNIHLKASAEVKAEAPSWLTTANKWLKNNLAIENAAYVGKNSLVVEKVDITVGAAGSVNASKWEATGMAKSVTVFKQDFVAVNTSRTGLDASTKFLEKKTAAAVLESGAFTSAVIGFRKM